jgi:hypothetical protein
MDASQEVLEYVARLPIGAHAALFHESDETAAQVLTAYMRGCVERRERLYFISSSEEDHKRFLNSAAINGNEVQMGECVNYISLMGFCFENGRLSWRKASDQVHTLVRDVDGSRVKGSRVIVLADQYLNNASRDELMQFERAWGWSFPFPLSVICSYDTRNLADPNWGDLIVELCRVHSHLIFKGLAAPRAEPLAIQPLSDAMREVQP